MRVGVSSVAGLGKAFDDKYCQVYMEVRSWWPGG